MILFDNIRKIYYGTYLAVPARKPSWTDTFVIIDQVKATTTVNTRKDSTFVTFNLALIA